MKPSTACRCALISVAALFTTIATTNKTSADIIQYDFTGTVTLVTQNSPFNLQATIGDQITGIFCYDTATGDLSSDPFFGNFPQTITTGFSFVLNGQTINTSNYGVFVTDDNPPNNTFDELEIFSSQGISVDGTPQPSADMYLQLRDTTGAVFLNDNLPPHTLTENDFDLTFGYILDTNNNDRIEFVVDDLWGIPAPATLVVFGLMLVGYKGRKR